MIAAIAIVGPTAVGKSDVADMLAARLGTSVVSADAMQVYRGMDIGTGKMMPGECRAPLLLVDVVDPQEPYSAALYQRDARHIIDTINAQGKPAVVCGGTGLYVKAALDVMEFPSGELGSDTRSRYDTMADQLGPEKLHELLAARDPNSAALIHPHNVRRVVRALEMLDEGVSYAEQAKGFSTPQAFYPTSYFALMRDREELYRRINLRVDKMMEAGLLDEVKRLAEAGCADALTSRQAIGYKELLDHLAGLCSLDEAVDLIKMRSRRYAKRQLSWFKRDQRITWIDMDDMDTEGAVEFILSSLERHAYA